MKTLQEIRNILESNKDELQKRYGIKEIGIFGSVVRGEQEEASDVDILIEPGAPIGLFEFVEMKHFLSDLIGIRVDLVMKRALKPRIGGRILKEVVYV